MDNSHNRLEVKLGRENEIFYYSLKEDTKISQIAKLWRNVVIYEKYSPAKFPNFVYICITRGKSYHFELKFFRAYKYKCI